MPAVVVVGGQWGDEGKGRIVDLLARKARVVARYSAGNNAGHTIVNELGEFKLHLVPAGIFYPEKTCLIGNGVAVDPEVLLGEISQLESQGIDTSKLAVSARAQVVMPWHRLIDRLDEERRGDDAIGTTGKGIGPCFTDKVARRGIRIVDLLEPEDLLARMHSVVDYQNQVITAIYGGEPIDFDECFAQYREFGQRLRPFVADTQALVKEALHAGEYVLLEGAQGSLLDLDHGTYEYVTSSVPSSTAGGATLGVGIGPTEVQRSIGVFKSYCTRVGNGPFPTELFGEIGDRLRDHGKEFGRGRVRHDDGPAATHRLARHGGGALLGGVQRALGAGADAARRARRAAGAEAVHRLRDRRRDGEDDAGESFGIAAGEARLRGAAGLDRTHLGAPQLRRPARRGAGLHPAGGVAAGRPGGPDLGRSRARAGDHRQPHLLGLARARGWVVL